MLHRPTVLKTCAVLPLFLGFWSCATILQPGPDRIPINTVPAGATVLLNGYLKGVTPLEVEVNRDERCSLEIYKEGYQRIYLDKDKVVAGWVFGNILFGGVIRIVVDLATHNQGKYSETPMLLRLEPNPSKKQKKKI